MWLLSFIPGISTLLQYLGNTADKLYDAKLAAEGSHEAKSADLLARELRLDEVEARLNAQAKAEIRGRWYAPENLMFYFVALPYWFKAITVDNVLSQIFDLGWTTPHLQGATAQTMTLVMAFWFGQRGVQNVAAIIAQAFGKR